MQWVDPSDKDTLTETQETRLWDSVDQFRANSGLKAQEYSGPILDIIFLRFAEVRFAQQRAKPKKTSASSRRGSRVDEPVAYHAEGILYLAPNARFDFQLNLPETADIGAKVNDDIGGRAQAHIEKHNPQLTGVLPKTYNLFTSTLLKELLKKVSKIPATVDYDNPHDATGRFDFVLANRPFNVNAVDTAMRMRARRHSKGTRQDLPERHDHERVERHARTGLPFSLPFEKFQYLKGEIHEVWPKPLTRS